MNTGRYSEIRKKNDFGGLGEKRVFETFHGFNVVDALTRIIILFLPKEVTPERGACATAYSVLSKNLAVIFQIVLRRVKL